MIRIAAVQIDSHTSASAHRTSYIKGAMVRKLGHLESADCDAVFIDEIGDMPLSLQAKLLRAIETKRFFRVGGTRELSMNIRFIYATNANLTSLVKEKRFREDLYYRVNVLRIHLPPLRERPEDIKKIAASFLKFYGKQISEAALRKLESADWRGNVRELKNVIERSCAVDGSTKILDANDIITDDEQGVSDRSELEEIFSLPLNKAAEEFEGRYRKRILEIHNGNKSQAALAAEIDKSNFFTRLKKYHL